MKDFILFKELQEKGLEELSKSAKAWWNEGPRYTLQLYRGSSDRKGRVYITSMNQKSNIPESISHKNKIYILDLDSIKETDIPIHFVPYVNFDNRGSLT